MSVESCVDADWKSPGVPGACNEQDGMRILQAAAAILRQGEALLQSLSPDVYTQKVASVFNASMGGHVRHSLDHFVCALQALERRPIDYDARERDRRVESDLNWALEVLRNLRGRVEGLSVAALDAPVRVRCEVSYGAGTGPETMSTLGRELAYSIVHAIHHYALIAVMAQLLGVALPPHFGMAPATVAHHQIQGLS